MGCSFRRLFHVAVGKTRKARSARQRAPLQVPWYPGTACLPSRSEKKFWKELGRETSEEGEEEVTAETADHKVIISWPARLMRLKKRGDGILWTHAAI